MLRFTLKEPNLSSPSELSARFATILGLSIGAGIAILSPADDVGSTANAAVSMTIAAGDGGTFSQDWGSQLRKAPPSHGKRFEVLPDQD